MRLYVFVLGVTPDYVAITIIVYEFDVMLAGAVSVTVEYSGVVAVLSPIIDEGLN